MYVCDTSIRTSLCCVTLQQIQSDRLLCVHTPQILCVLGIVCVVWCGVVQTSHNLSDTYSHEILLLSNMVHTHTHTPNQLTHPLTLHNYVDEMYLSVMTAINRFPLNWYKYVCSYVTVRTTIIPKISLICELDSTLIFRS